MWMSASTNWSEKSETICTVDLLEAREEREEKGNVTKRLQVDSFVERDLESSLLLLVERTAWFSKYSFISFV